MATPDLQLRNPRGPHRVFHWTHWFVAAVLLLLPAVAMQFTREVNWTAFDFLVFGVLLLLTCAGIELALRVLRTSRQRLFGVLGMVLGFLAVWAFLAVGMGT